MKIIYLFCSCIFLIQSVQAKSVNETYSFHIEYTSLKGTVLKNVSQYTWRKNCPVDLSELILLKMSYWGFDAKPHIGELIVHRKASPEVILIFRELFERKFPISSINPMYEYHGSDDASMLDNNTVAFNCRSTTGYKNKFSKHSYGIAIDINPVINPYYKDGKVLPPTAIENIDRKKDIKGIIKKKGICYTAFKMKGWTWGGDWKTLKDYQHFEKNLTLFDSEKKYSLKFEKLPSNSTVKIMNILRGYNTDKFLSRGLYDVKIISKNEVKRVWIKVDKNVFTNYQNL